MPRDGAGLGTCPLKMIFYNVLDSIASYVPDGPLSRGYLGKVGVQWNEGIRNLLGYAAEQECTSATGC